MKTLQEKYPELSLIYTEEDLNYIKKEVGESELELAEKKEKMFNIIDYIDYLAKRKADINTCIKFSLTYDRYENWIYNIPKNLYLLAKYYHENFYYLYYYELINSNKTLISLAKEINGEDFEFKTYENFISESEKDELLKLDEEINMKFNLPLGEDWRINTPENKVEEVELYYEQRRLEIINNK